MWFWMKIRLFFSKSGWDFKKFPKTKTTLSHIPKAIFPGEKGQLNPSAASKIWLYTLGWPISVISLKFQTDEWSKRRCSKGTCGTSASSGFFGSNFQGVDVGDDWKIRFFLKRCSWLVTCFFFFARGNFCNEKPAASLATATAHKCFKKNTMSFYRRHPPINANLWLLQPPPQKNAINAVGFKQGYVRKRAYCELCDELARPRKPHRCSIPKGAMGSHRWAIVCEIHWD